MNLESLKKIVEYGMVKHLGLVSNGVLVDVYPEKYEIFNTIASNAYITHMKILRSAKKYLFLEIFVSGERIVIYPLGLRDIILLHLSKDVNVELVIDEIAKTIGKKPEDRKVLL